LQEEHEEESKETNSSDESKTDEDEEINNTTSDGDSVENGEDKEGAPADKEVIKEPPQEPASSPPPQPPQPPVITTQEGDEHVVLRYLEDEMKSSYIDYSMSVIVQRALPDVRDGLKPVHRRILYSMHEAGISSDKPYKKSARVVGDVLGKYHPHGDTAVYDALVRMTQDFSLRYPLLDGQGNFGSVDGDNPAAMRYTETRLAKISNEMLVDIDKDTIDFAPNYDASMEEPLVLPSKLPNLLLNGSSGIAVGMATNIPPHNIGEVVDGIIRLIENPELNTLDLMDNIKGPDFPTGGIIYGTQGIIHAYHTGRGLVRVRGKTHIEPMKGDKKRIIITELPYQVNKAHLIEDIAKLVKDKRVEGITDLRDESDRDGMRIVIELRRDVIEDVVINQLYKHTALASTFGIINLSLVKNQPRVLSLKETLEHFINHRRVVVRNRTQYVLDKAEKRIHIVKGLLTALQNIDAIIELIRKSSNAEEASEALMSKFELSKEQTKAILDMRLQRLTSMEGEKLNTEHEDLLKSIADLKDILANESRIDEIIKDELLEIRNKYFDERRTEIVVDAQEIELEDLIPVEDVVITITNTGYIKRLPIDTYKQQRRGGKGMIGIRTKEEDYVVDVFITSTHNYILFFTNKGKVFWLKAYRIPQGDRYAKGKAIVNLLPRLIEGEKIQAMIPVHEFKEDHHVVFVTRNGTIKKTKLPAYSRPRENGIWAIKLAENDELVDAKLTDGTKEIVIATADGKANRFNEKEARHLGRYTTGVRGIRLRKGDEVRGLAVVDPEAILLSITENGYGKRSRVADYRCTHRGSQGVINMKTDERNGRVITVLAVDEDNELIVTSQNGLVIRIPIQGISIIGRATKGVRVMNLNEGDKVVAVARMLREDEEEKLVEDAEQTLDKEKKTPSLEKTDSSADASASTIDEGDEGSEDESAISDNEPMEDEKEELDIEEEEDEEFEEFEEVDNE
jgi:DNA gyrase subunit A